MPSSPDQTTKYFVIGFAIVEALLIGWMMLSVVRT